MKQYESQNVTDIDAVNVVGRVQTSDRHYKLCADEICQSADGPLATILSFHQRAKTEQLQCRILRDMKPSSKLTYISRDNHYLLVELT